MPQLKILATDSVNTLQPIIKKSCNKACSQGYKAFKALSSDVPEFSYVIKKGIFNRFLPKSMRKITKITFFPGTKNKQTEEVIKNGFVIEKHKFDINGKKTYERYVSSKDNLIEETAFGKGLAKTYVQRNTKTKEVFVQITNPKGELIYQRLTNPEGTQILGNGLGSKIRKNMSIDKNGNVVFYEKLVKNRMKSFNRTKNGYENITYYNDNSIRSKGKYENGKTITSERFLPRIRIADIWHI